MSTRPTPVHVIGASGRSGAALCRALLARGVPVVPVVRDADRFAATGIADDRLADARIADDRLADARIADLGDPLALTAALAGAVRIASTAHARNAGAILAASPRTVSRLVFLGSTRKFTAWPDAHGNGVLAGEAALMASGRPGIMLHPTMIYGAQGENNVRRLAGLLARLPIVPLPNGGRARVQPIHQSDVTAAIIASLDLAPGAPEALVIAGAASVTYAAFVQAVASAAGIGRKAILRVPMSLLLAAAPLIGMVPGLPRIGRDEIRRLVEDKDFDVAPFRNRLGIDPIDLDAGLAMTFSNRDTRAE